MVCCKRCSLFCHDTERQPVHFEKILLEELFYLKLGKMFAQNM